MDVCRVGFGGGTLVHIVDYVPALVSNLKFAEGGLDWQKRCIGEGWVFEIRFREGGFSIFKLY